MNNDKYIRRKKKLAERARREKSLKLRLANRDEFPDIVFDTTHADAGFAALIRDAVSKFRFDELPEFEQTAFKIVRRRGARAAYTTLKAAIAEAVVVDPTNAYAQIGDILWFLTAGELIFAKIPEDIRYEYFPFHDFRIIPFGNRVVVQCSSLFRSRTSKGWVFHSRYAPTVRVSGQDYIVAFPRHVVERIEERLLGGRMNYAALGDVYGYFELYRHFELCSVRGDGERHTEMVSAVTFFEECEEQKLWSHRYVHEILGREYDSTKGTPYYRVGYCPIALDGGFAVTTSFLPPGFTKTPEYSAISRSKLPFSEKTRLERMSTDNNALTNLVKDGDFSAVRCYHVNGVPQVVQTHEKWYASYEL